MNHLLTYLTGWVNPWLTITNCDAEGSFILMAKHPAMIRLALDRLAGPCDVDAITTSLSCHRCNDAPMRHARCTSFPPSFLASKRRFPKVAIVINIDTLAVWSKYNVPPPPFTPLGKMFILLHPLWSSMSLIRLPFKILQDDGKHF